MKYLKYFEEDIQLKLWDDLPTKYKDDIVFHNNNWMVVQPKSIKTLLELSDDTEWGTNFNLYNNKIYVNINKKTDEKILFDFYRSDFIDQDEDTIYLKDFFDVNNDLFKFYGEIVECSDIVKDGNDYWIVVSGNEWFSDFFDTSKKNISNDFVKSVLSGDSFQFFEKETRYSEIDEYGIKAIGDNLILLKVILILEKEQNYDDYSYEIEDIEDYDDVVDLVKKYGIKSLKNYLKRCVCEGTEQADEAKAYESITNAFYDFFNLEVGTAKWEYYQGSKYQQLFIKFKSNDAAYYAKFRINGYDDSYSDDLIDYSTPYNGYDGDDKVKNEAFNYALSGRIDEYNNDDIDNDTIYEYYNKWIEMAKEGKSEEVILSELKMTLDSKKYNI